MFIQYLFNTYKGNFEIRLNFSLFCGIVMILKYTDSSIKHSICHLQKKLNKILQTCHAIYSKLLYTQIYERGNFTFFRLKMSSCLQKFRHHLFFYVSFFFLISSFKPKNMPLYLYWLNKDFVAKRFLSNHHFSFSIYMSFMSVQRGGKENGGS